MWWSSKAAPQLRPAHPRACCSRKMKKSRSKGMMSASAPEEKAAGGVAGAWSSFSLHLLQETQHGWLSSPWTQPSFCLESHLICNVHVRRFTQRQAAAVVDFTVMYWSVACVPKPAIHSWSGGHGLIYLRRWRQVFVFPQITLKPR